MARGGIVTREVDRIAVYGREEGLSAYELVDLAGEGDARDSAPWVTRYEQGLAKYRDRDLTGAMAEFEAVLRDRPQDQPAKLLLERCRETLGQMPDDWRPVAVLKSK